MDKKVWHIKWWWIKENSLYCAYTQQFLDVLVHVCVCVCVCVCVHVCNGITHETTRARGENLMTLMKSAEPLQSTWVMLYTVE